MGNKNYKELKSFNECCIVLGFTELEFKVKYDGLGLSDYLIATARLEIINKAINGTWSPDWNNTNQPKYYPYFRMGGSSGFGFSGTSYHCSSTYSHVGSRLCFESENQARYAGEQFVEEYKAVYLINKNEISLKEFYKNDEIDIKENVENKPIKNFNYEDIKTYEDACEKLGISTRISISSGLSELNKSTTALYKLMIIFKAINNGWEPDWNNYDENKYYPYKGMVCSSGFGFSGTIYGFGSASSLVGSRLCTYSKDIALYIGEQFEDLYKDWFIIDKSEISDAVCITTNQMEEIYRIACQEWKKKIVDLTNEYRDKNPFTNKVYLPNTVIKQMFDAATAEQKPILNKIFK